MQGIIQQAFQDGIELRERCMHSMADSLEKAAEILIHCLKEGGKVLLCGNGGSAADAQHFAGELVNRFEMNRPGLAAFALTNDASVITSIGNDFDFDSVFSRQIEALGRAGDVLIAISTSGDSANVVHAVQAASNLAMPVIALTGKSGGKIANLDGVSLNLNVAHSSTPRIQEIHITCLHVLCSLIDEKMYGSLAQED